MLHINVSQQLIDTYGERIFSPVDCPIFHALSEAGLNVHHVDFGGFELVVNDKYQRVEWPSLWPESNSPVHDWQKYGPRPPFEFDVDTDIWQVRNLTLVW